MAAMEGPRSIPMPIPHRKVLRKQRSARVQRSSIRALANSSCPMTACERHRLRTTACWIFCSRVTRRPRTMQIGIARYWSGTERRWLRRLRARDLRPCLTSSLQFGKPATSNSHIAFLPRAEAEQERDKHDDPLASDEDFCFGFACGGLGFCDNRNICRWHFGHSRDRCEDGHAYDIAECGIRP